MEALAHPCIALWCHPRSLSTAFERIMRERGDLRCFHEPFMYWYYLGRGKRRFPNFQPDPDKPTSYAEVREGLRREASQRPVFFKDMAYYVESDIQQDVVFARELTHVFLIRDPALSIASYHKLDPEFTDEEAGLCALLALHEFVTTKIGCRAIVVDAYDLSTHPESVMRSVSSHAGLEFSAGSLAWQAPPPEEWQSVAAWHGKVSASSSIQSADDWAVRRECALQFINADERLLSMYQRHQSAFATLHAKRTRVDQKVA